MRAPFRLIALAVLTAAVLAIGSAPVGAARQVLYGTIGACNNATPGGPCTQTSTLVQLDPGTGALLRVIGPVGFTVNGLAWDRKNQTLYASTAIGDVKFHGLIRINPLTGAGKPIDRTVHNFGLAGADSPIHSISIDGHGRIVGWYDEFPVGPGQSDTFVKIDKNSGIATEFPNTGIDTAGNGLSFDEVNYLWNIDTPRRNGTNPLTQTAYLMDPMTGKAFKSVSLNPPTNAALGDFNPLNDLYYGLTFDPGTPATSIVVVDPRAGTVTPLGPTVDNLHTLAFAKVVLDR